MFELNPKMEELPLERSATTIVDDPYYTLLLGMCGARAFQLSELLSLAPEASATKPPELREVDIEYLYLIYNMPCREFFIMGCSHD